MTHACKQTRLSCRGYENDPQNDPAIDRVEDYHQRSKHSLQKYASWQVRLLDACSDEQIAGILGLNRTSDYINVESEAPDAILQISCGDNDTNNYDTKQVETLLDMLASGHWHGRANRLSPHHFEHWDVTEEIAHYCQ